MRNPRELQASIDALARMSNSLCPYSIVAFDAEEEAWMKAKLAGKRGAKKITVRLVTGAERDQLLAALA